MVVHRFTVVTLSGGLSVEGILLVFPWWHPATGSQFAFTCMLLKEEKRFPYFSSPEQNRTEQSRETGHTHTLIKYTKKQTDASVVHLGCYLRRISPHKGTFIGLPSICRVQEQTMVSSDRWWSYQMERGVQGRGEWWFGGGGLVGLEGEGDEKGFGWVIRGSGHGFRAVRWTLLCQEHLRTGWYLKGGAGSYKRLRHHCDIKWLCTLNYI